MKSAQVAAATTALLCGGVGVGASVPHDILLGRWRLALDLFGRVFVDDVGLEPGSIISELGGFPVKVGLGVFYMRATVEAFKHCTG